VNAKLVWGVPGLFAHGLAGAVDVADHGDENQEENRKQYIELHKKFTANKAEKIKKAVVKRRGYIADLPETSENIEIAYFDAIKQNIIDLHDKNSEKDDKTGILTSWGIVRMANITPCAELGKYLMNTDWPSDYQVKVMVYHSQQVLLMRHTQEKYLDKLLNRKEPDTIFKEPIVRKCLDNSEAKNMIFIVVSTPVEEIGRDHDFSWAIIEPSSFRSIIQLAGRVRRHRQEKPENENIAVLRYNFKGYKNKNSNIDEKVFVRPGYENISKLNSHDLNAIIDENLIKEGINSIPRIIAPDSLNEKNSLIDLEHYSARLSLGNFINKGPQTPLGWISEAWWLTGFSQILAPFRKGQKSEILYLLPKFPGNENTLFTFCLKDADKYEPYEIVFGITNKEPEINKESIWLDRNYYKLLEEYSENGYVDKSAKRYGFIEVVKYNDNDKFEYSHILGLLRK
jgi:CRISPR-associated endonuclease/helicase Cas3